MESLALGYVDLPALGAVGIADGDCPPCLGLRCRSLVVEGMTSATTHAVEIAYRLAPFTEAGAFFDAACTPTAITRAEDLPGTARDHPLAASHALYRSQWSDPHTVRSKPPAVRAVWGRFSLYFTRLARSACCFDELQRRQSTRPKSTWSVVRSLVAPQYEHQGWSAR